MNEEFKRFCINNRGKIMIGAGLIIGSVLGYSVGNRKLLNTRWNFSIVDNARLAVSLTPEGSKVLTRWVFSENDTNEIIDHLMKQFNTGD